MTNHIKSLSITHFRGFYDMQTVDFAIPNGQVASGMTIIVGPNNSGKTTIIEAIKKFCKGNPNEAVLIDKNERHEGQDLFLQIENNQNQTKSIKLNWWAVAKIENENIYPNTQHIYFLNTNRKWSANFTQRQDLSSHIYKVNLLLTEKNDNPKDIFFWQRLIQIELNNDKKEQYNNILKEIIPNFTDWHIESQQGRMYIEYKTWTDDVHNTDLLWDGVISIFKIALALVDTNDEEIIFVDEPENSLHPQAQKRLIQILWNYSQNKQIVITTHSPYLVRWEDIKQWAKIIRLNKYEDKKCTISHLHSEPWYYDKVINIMENRQKPHILDIVSKEIFFAENVVFVEWQEDMGLINKFIKEEWIKTNFQIFGYGSAGSQNIQYFLEIAQSLNINSGALFDGNESFVFDKCKKLFLTSCIQILSKFDIRDKKERNIEWIFDESGNLKEENRKELFDIIKKFIDFFGK